ncbi:hypothetical protein M378DRAFT_19576 [Amanita muscaria Koide BX008]|uniref:Uncharacterized protein n=1 Tax=Amanita muscaria (strain Koide BX008) TaxID=946122 RepID=A0A0C2SIK3_AMAMK|nr:hypothetical protein M378DRAFT_19576 [Amanita muscaria Koide BX008]
MLNRLKRRYGLYIATIDYRAGCLLHLAQRSQFLPHIVSHVVNIKSTKARVILIT